jgi:RNase adaptor protein for sRNA GlmZ degradation
VIISFGFKNGPVQRVDKTFDVRDLTHDIGDRGFIERANEIRDYAEAHPNERIAIGCTAGKHRSRALANHVATAIRTSVLHRDK